MISEIVKEVSALHNTDDATSYSVLLWTQIDELQMAQYAALNNMKIPSPEFVSVKYNTHKHNNETHRKQN